MEIIFDRLNPEFLEKEKIKSSEIWDQQVHLKEKHIQVVAQSGRGKTSLVHFIYGLRKDYNGSIRIGQSAVADYSAEELSEKRRNHISIVFQDLRLFPDHTALQNILIKRSLMPYEDDRVTEMAQSLGIKNKLSQQARHCSYGEQQRIAIIRALQQPFDLLVLDEPFSHLDGENAQKALELILQEAARRDATIMLMDLEPVSSFPAAKIYHL